ncbi:MAG: outer membrane lipid asymmetry maintenance protein MlaD [Rhodobacteraceae bacterium]|nr:outer membrane lipid asymmetry maintenance protein MlaD [Paracoccaceae bacterium]
MAKEQTEILVGGVVLALAIGFAAYMGQVTDRLGGGAQSYPLTASFDSLEGVSIGTDVRLAGVKIGSVAHIDLDPQTLRAQAEFAIREGILLPEDSSAVIESEGLLGGSFVNILPGAAERNLASGEGIFYTQSAVSLVSLLLKFATAGGGAQ